MIGNYLKAKWSKGLTGKKADIETKDLRLLSCFGNGQNITVCPGLRPSEKKMGMFICGECGCGDKKDTFLNGDEGDYSKLDHPYVTCPRKMPGFSNYNPFIEDAQQDERKKLVELHIGEDLLKNKSLVKPEMSEEEKEELKRKREEQKKSGGGCSKCEERRRRALERRNQNDG